MNKRTLLVCFGVLFVVAGFAQTVTLTFTARDAANQHVQTEFIRVINHSKNWQEFLFWPDTVLTIQNNTGIQENETAQALSLQLSPNPFNGATEVTLSVAEEGMVRECIGSASLLPMRVCMC